MRIVRFAAALALSGALLLASPAAACSVAPGYRVPTNLELTANADLILLGTAEEEIPAADGSSSMGEVVVRPMTVLKGEALPAEVRVRGYLSDDPSLVVASNPRELFDPNPGALIGGCTRYIFRRGMVLLLFLERNDEGMFELASYPFARSAEDVPSPQAPWVKAVRLYVEIAALPERDRRAALAARRDALRAANGDPDAALLADDIDRQIRRRRIPPYD